MDRLKTMQLIAGMVAVVYCGSASFLHVLNLFMHGGFMLYWNLKQHLPWLHTSTMDWLRGYSNLPDPWLLWILSFVLVVPLIVACAWLLWTGMQYGFRTAHCHRPYLANWFLLLVRRRKRPWVWHLGPPGACPSGIPRWLQETKCALAFVFGFVCYVWFVVSSTVGTCALPGRLERLRVTPLGVVTWHHSFPGPWPPGFVPNVLWIYAFSLGLLLLGQFLGRQLRNLHVLDHAGRLDGEKG